MKSFASYLLQISGCAVLTAFLAVPAEAGSLEGTVTYGESAVPSAMVSLYQTDTGRKSVTITNSLGAYKFDGLPGGSYIVLVEKDGRRIYQGKVDVPEQSARIDIGLDTVTPAPVAQIQVVKGIELSGGRRIALQGELQGKVWVYVSPVCKTPCRPQLLVFKTDPQIANYSEFTTMNLIRPSLRTRGKLLFDEPVGPEAVKASFRFEGRDYRLTGRAKGRIDSLGGAIQFDVYKQ